MIDDIIVFQGEVEVYSWAISSNNGVRIRIRLSEREDLARFEGERVMRRGGREGRPNAASMYSINLSKIGDPTKTESIIAWYKGPSWSQGTGALVQFELEHESALGSLRTCRTADACDPPDEYALVVVQLDDMGQPVSQSKRKAVESAATGPGPAKGGPRSKHVARRCLETDFVEFLVDTGRVQPDPSPKNVADTVRDICGIQSRAELDHNEASWQLWRMLESAFIRYREPA